MIRKKIKDIGTVYSGATPKTNIAEYWNGDIAWVTPKEINKLNSQFLNETERYITHSGLKSCSANMLPKGSILFTSRAPIGLLAINEIEVCTNQGFKSIVLNNGYSALYVYYFLKTQVKQLNDLGTGSTFKELSKSTFEKFEIPIPENLVDQIRIAEVLRNVETLITQRKDSINLLDDLLRSTFLDMFLKYLKNNQEKKLFSLCEKITDGTHNTPKRLEKGIKFITGKHIRPFYIDFENSDYVSEEDHKEIYKRCNPEFGDILYTNIGVNLGTAVMNNVNFEFSMKNVALLKVKKQIINPRFLEHFLNLTSKRNRILKLNSSGGAQQFMSLNQIKNIDVAVPSIKLQNKFALIVEKAEKVKEQYKESLKELENLFGSLSQRAFKGELDLSKLDVSAQIREIEKKIEAESGLDISLETKLTKQMQQIIEQTEKLQKALNPVPNILSKSLEKQIEAINKISAPFQNLKPYQIPESLSQAMKSFDGIKSITSQLNQDAKEQFKSKLTWEEVNFEMVANWIKDEYSEYHFNSEILMHFLENERVTFSNYHSSEELKTNPKLNEADDIKSFVFSALKGKNQFIKLEQFFYDAVTENVQLKLRSDDYEIIKDKEKELRSGIYFKVVE